ncbi:LacI family DNA-binding transcriptional regulator [Evansella cellulosilytica]|uniref:Transcriptional regulator, LacI family n=1 Tax=Evansella cellulosilytica (strain ATCC 21833 / DSM 2522 / FERM P-1141 / JCM 9156 / N-4) TaxID=649639 RepID=E6TXF8_EVAC2|nr:LacI family DNA-binding transcriptional regulator [Evansella cellulosilytica]ADU28772.1 transcriptional regulator, LacI family [Evansella cellulosilytica DSM 2522]
MIQSTRDNKKRKVGGTAMVTIKDVAKRVNVSPSTVSRVIANSSRISEKTKERVRRAMDELGYHPNLNARSLSNKATQTIGVIMPITAQYSFQNPFFPEVIRGISMKAYQDNYGLYLSTGQKEEEIFEEVKQMVYGGRVDGILLLYSSINDKIMPFLQEKNFPFVLIGRPHNIDENDITFVNNDNVKKTKTLTEYLLLLGHKKIGFISGSLDYVVTIDNLEGYKTALNNANISIREEYIVLEENYQKEIMETGQDAVIELMSLEERPTALVVTDDIMTFGVLSMLGEMGIRVPEDLSIVSSNNVMISELSSPPMTTADINIYDLGYKGVEYLINKIKEPELPEKKLIVPYKLIKRQSCKKI